MEKNNPFRRISPELFTRVLSFTDAPSLASSMAICSSWREPTFRSPSLFLNFKMKGTVEDIISGLNFFKLHATEKIESMDLELFRLDQTSTNPKQAQMETLSKRTSVVGELEVLLDQDASQQRLCRSDGGSSRSSLEVFRSKTVSCPRSLCKKNLCLFNKSFATELYKFSEQKASNLCLNEWICDFNHDKI